MRGESQAEFHIQYTSCQFIIFTGSESERERKKKVTTVGKSERDPRFLAAGQVQGLIWRIQLLKHCMGQKREAKQNTGSVTKR